MSNVTGVVVYAAYVPKTVRELITTQPYDVRGWNLLGDLSDEFNEDPNARKWGGSKYAPGHLYGAGFNYFNEDDFLRWLAELPWTVQSKRGVIVIMQYEYEENPKVIYLKDVELAPAG